MTTATFTDDERARLLSMAGVKPEHVEVLAPIADPVDEIEQFAQAVAEVSASTDDALVQDILKRAKGNKDTALSMCDSAAKAEFDRIKLSKMDAARLGLDIAGKSEHNANAWKHCQGVAETLKASVRRHFRDNGGFVAAKITKAKRNPELDAFLLQHGDNELVRNMAHLLGL